MPNVSLAGEAGLAHALREYACEFFSYGDYSLRAGDPDASAAYAFPRAHDLRPGHPDRHIRDVPDDSAYAVVYALAADERQGTDEAGKVDNHLIKNVIGPSMLEAMIDIRRQQRLNHIRWMGVLIVAGNEPLEFSTGNPLEAERDEGWELQDGLWVPESGVHVAKERIASWVPQDDNLAFVTLSRGGWFNGELHGPPITQAFEAYGIPEAKRRTEAAMKDILQNPGLKVLILDEFKNPQQQQANDNSAQLALDIIVSDNVDKRQDLATGTAVELTEVLQRSLGEEAAAYVSIRQGGRRQGQELSQRQLWKLRQRWASTGQPEGDVFDPSTSDI